MNVVLTDSALEDLDWWRTKDKKHLARIIRLLKEISKDPEHGIGKPEHLKYNLSGMMSRRIDSEHRIVYEVKSKAVIIHALRYHYKN